MKTVMYGVVVVLGSLAIVAAQSRPADQASRREPARGVDVVRHGEYLATAVAMCVQCHTPRNERGELMRLQLLEGAQVPVRSPWANQQWAFQAPSLAGLPGGWSEEDVIQLLMTGKDPRGRSPHPPMPAYRMNREDATAVAAYLKAMRPGAATNESER